MTCTYTVAGIVTAICRRAGIPDANFNTDLLTGEVQGFMVSSSEQAFSFIRALSDVKFFDPANYDGVLHFVPRGLSSVVTIDLDDLLIDSEDEVVRRDAGAVPRIMHLNYMDTEGQLETNKQTSDRSINYNGEGELSVSSPVVMTANEAAQALTVSHKIAVDEQRGEITIKLPDSYIAIAPADIVMFNGSRMRVTSVQIDEGFQTYKLSFDRGSAYVSAVEGLPPPEMPPVLYISPGETMMEFIDAHVLDGSDDPVQGYYFGIAGDRQSWAGALIELSIDGGANYIESRIENTDCLIGELTETLGTHSAYFPDPVNVITVQIHTFAPDITTATFAEMLNRSNRCIIGDEIISFGNAEEIEPGIFELSYLLRGRLGAAVQAHSIGERFVLLQLNRVGYIQADLSYIGQELDFRATSLNSSITTTISDTYNALSHVERQPAYLQARREDGDVYITWIGVGRRGSRNAIQMSLYFTGYNVDLNGSETFTEDDSITLSDPGGELTIRVSQVNSITGAGDYSEIVI